MTISEVLAMYGGPQCVTYEERETRAILRPYGGVEAAYPHEWVRICASIADQITQAVNSGKNFSTLPSERSRASAAASSPPPPAVTSMTLTSGCPADTR